MVPEDLRPYVSEVEQKVASGEIQVESALNMNAEEIEEIKASVRP